MMKNTVYRLLITNVLIIISLVFIVLGVVNYLIFSNILKESSSQQNQLIFDDIRSVIDYQSVSLKVVEEQMISQLQMLSSDILAKMVRSGQSPQNIDLVKIKNSLGNISSLVDLYIINRQGVVVNTTFSRDKGLNLFSFGKEHTQYLESVWTDNVFKTAGFTIESVTGRPRIYTYQPTPDGKYILELGVSSPGAEKLVQFINQRLKQISSVGIRNIKSAEILTVVDTSIYSLGQRKEYHDKESIISAFLNKEMKALEHKTDSGWYRYSYQYIARNESGLYKHFVVRVIVNIDDEKNILFNQGISFISMFIITLGLIGAFIYFNSMRLVKLINKLTEASAVISTGDYSHRIEIDNPQELAQLASSFNQMVERIHEYNEQLENKVVERTAKLLRQKEEIERTSQALASKNKQMEQINSIIDTMNAEVNYIQLFSSVLNKLSKLEGVHKLAFLDSNNSDKRFEVRAQIGFQNTEIPYLHTSPTDFYALMLKEETEENSFVYLLHKNQQGSFSQVVIILEQSAENIAVVVLQNNDGNGIPPEEIEMIKQLRDYLLAAYIRSQLMLSLEETLNNLKSTQEQLIQQEKLASLGQLTAGIAHEIRNPLNFISNFTQLSLELTQSIKDELATIALPNQFIPEDIDTLNSNLTKIQKHSQRAESIIREMLSHSASSDSDFEEVNILNLIKDYTQLAYLGFRNDNPEFVAVVNFDPLQSDFMIKIQPQQFSRVIINLISNACYSMHRKKLTMGSNYSPECNITLKLEQKYLSVIISDNGEGIPDTVLKKIFQPFFTTKPTGKGTGLGLSLSYDIITKTHKGSIEVHSEINKGALFHMKIPC